MKKEEAVRLAGDVVLELSRCENLMTNLSSRLWGLAQRSTATLLELIYPGACAGCGNHGSGVWCTDCHAAVQWLHGADAVQPLVFADGTQSRVISCGVFADALRNGIHALKFEGRPQIARSLAVPLVTAWHEQRIVAQCIVAIPLHPSRERERGYNQSTLLAQALSAHVGIPFEKRALKRTRVTQQQALLSQTERAANVRGAFLADRPLLEGRHVIIIDDVFTTGATLTAAAEACREAGAAEVTAMMIARAE